MNIQPAAAKLSLREIFPEIKVGDVYESLAGSHMERPFGLPIPIKVPYPGYGEMLQVDDATMAWREVRTPKFASFDGIMKVGLEPNHLSYEIDGKIMGLLPHHSEGRYRITNAQRGVLELQLEGGRGTTSSMRVKPLTDDVYSMNFVWETPYGTLREDDLGGTREAVDAYLAKHGGGAKH